MRYDKKSYDTLVQQIKELKKEKKKLQHTQDLFYIILQSLDSGITVQNNKEQLIYANQAAARMSGYGSPIKFVNTSAQEILRKFLLFDEQGKPFDFSQLPGRLAIQDKKPHERVLRFFVNATQKEHWAFIRATPVLNAEGRVEFVVNSFYDITKSKLQEKRTEHFIAVGSHELKTPLAGIKALAQLLEKYVRTKRYRRIQEMTDKVDQKVNELNSIVNDFLDVEKINIGMLEVVTESFDFDRMVDETVEDLREIIKPHIIVQKGMTGKIINADKDRIVQVLRNMIRNARKYSPSADKIIVETSVGKTHVRVGVTDFGIGISKDEKRRIFEPFFRVRNEQTKKIGGLGLGLHISSKIIALHGGKMSVESALGKGSTFFFTLPVGLKVKKKAYQF